MVPRYFYVYDSETKIFERVKFQDFYSEETRLPISNPSPKTSKQFKITKKPNLISIELFSKKDWNDYYDFLIF